MVERTCDIEWFTSSSDEDSGRTGRIPEVSVLAHSGPFDTRPFESRRPATHARRSPASRGGSAGTSYPRARMLTPNDGGGTITSRPERHFIACATICRRWWNGGVGFVVVVLAGDARRSSRNKCCGHAPSSKPPRRAGVGASLAGVREIATAVPRCGGADLCTEAICRQSRGGPVAADLCTPALIGGRSFAAASTRC
jgi:hypothetical protein